MEIYQKKEMCCGCGACIEICPVRAIRKAEDREGFFYPEVNTELCIKCGKCRKVCPTKAHDMIENENLYLGVQAKSKKIRYSSSSGGMFSIVAQYVLRRQGIVYGAAYDENMRIIHKAAETEEELERIKRTKYVQSNMDGIYEEIESHLRQQRWVLFCGTPCQADALIRYLNQDYEKLIVIDLVCYGVSSPGMWKRYISYLEHTHRGKMTDFSFRDKRNSDNGQMRSYRINGKEYAGSLYRDIYCRIYFKNYILRPSCYKCQFCSVDRKSDFTIGDFWGIKHVRPDMDDGMGTSMVIAHSYKAKKIWDEIKEELNWFKCEKQDLLQPRLWKPTEQAKGRWLFMLLYRILFR